MSHFTDEQIIYLIKHGSSDQIWGASIHNERDFKKQFKYYSLRLHPDKTTMEGSKEAFQLIQNFYQTGSENKIWKDNKVSKNIHTTTHPPPPTHTTTHPPPTHTTTHPPPTHTTTHPPPTHTTTHPPPTHTTTHPPPPTHTTTHPPPPTHTTTHPPPTHTTTHPPPTHTTTHPPPTHTTTHPPPTHTTTHPPPTHTTTHPPPTHTTTHPPPTHTTTHPPPTHTTTHPPPTHTTTHPPPTHTTTHPPPTHTTTHPPPPRPNLNIINSDVTMDNFDHIISGSETPIKTGNSRNNLRHIFGNNSDAPGSIGYTDKPISSKTRRHTKAKATHSAICNHCNRRNHLSNCNSVTQCTHCKQYFMPVEIKPGHNRPELRCACGATRKGACILCNN